jgi:hypothetical protein
VYALSAPVKIFTDAGSVVTIALLSSSPGGGAIVGVYGHLIPTP